MSATSQGAGLAAAVARGGEIVLPAGTYVVPTFSAPSNTRIIGRGEGLTTLTPAGTAPVLVGNAPNVVNVSLEGVTLNNESYVAPPSGTAIAFTGTSPAQRPSNIRIANTEIIGFAQAIHNTLCANVDLADLFIQLCGAGVLHDTCADTDISGTKVQNAIGNPGNTGFGFAFTNDGTAGASDEGVRMGGCSTNGQAAALLVRGQNWGSCGNFSFTTGAGNMVVVQGGSNWQFGTGQIAPASGFASLVTDAASAACSFTNILCALGSFGVSLDGADHILSACGFKANSNVDVALSGTGLVVTGNRCASVGVPWSIVGSAGLVVTGNSCVGVVA